MGSGSKNAADSAPTASTLAPPLTDPYSWFDYYDKDASNSLDQEEVVPHPDNIQVDAYAQLLVTVQGLKEVVGE
mgnify:CR=1 FL=1